MENNLSSAEVKELVYNWFKKLTEHAPVGELLSLISGDDDLLIEFPDCPITNESEFRKWYHDVTHRFFDEQHIMQMLDISLTQNQATVKLIVNWQTKTWEPPAPYSAWEGYSIHQDWIVKKDSKTDKAVIVKYKVGAFDSFKRITEVQ